MRRRTRTKIAYGVVFFILGILVGLYVLPQVSFLPWYGSAVGEAKGEQALVGQSGDVIKIGALLPLSGELASLGDSSKKAIDLALQDAGATDVKVIYEDSKCSPRDASTAAQKLIAFDDTPIIIGDLCSASTVAVVPTINNAGVVLVSPAASDVSLSNSSDFFFRTVSSDLVQGRSMALFAKEELQYKKVAIMFVNNEYGVGIADAFSKEFQAQGGVIVSSEVFEVSSSDVRTQLSKIKEARPDALYIIAYPRQAVMVLEQVNELNLGVAVIGSEALYDPVLLKSSASDGLIVLVPHRVDNVQYAQFRSRYVERYGEEPSAFAAESYDAATLALLALKRSDGLSEGLKNELARTSQYKGVSGVITFDKQGDRIEEFVPVIVKGSEFVQIPRK